MGGATLSQLDKLYSGQLSFQSRLLYPHGTAIHISISSDEAADRLALRELVDAYAHLRRTQRRKRPNGSVDRRHALWINVCNFYRVTKRKKCLFQSSVASPECHSQSAIDKSIATKRGGPKGLPNLSKTHRKNRRLGLNLNLRR
jgi:hypothetical protein